MNINEIKTLIKAETKKMVSSLSFLFSIIIGVGLIAINFIQQIYNRSIGMDQVSVFEKCMSIHTDFYAGLIYVWIFPLLVALPYSTSMATDIKSRYYDQLIIRFGRKNYYITKFVLAFSSGALVIFLIQAIDFLLMLTTDKIYYPIPHNLSAAVNPGSFCSVLYYQNPFLFYFIWMIVSAIWGGVTAVACCALGFYIKNTGILLATIMMIFIAEEALSDFISIMINGLSVELGWITLKSADIVSLNPWWSIFGGALILFAGSIVLFIININKEQI